MKNLSDAGTMCPATTFKELIMANYQKYLDNDGEQNIKSVSSSAQRTSKSEQVGVDYSIPSKKMTKADQGD